MTIRALAAAAAIGIVASPALAQNPPPYARGMTLELARKCISLAEAESRKNSWAMAIAVIDDGGNMAAFVRMDNTQLASSRIAIEKAKTANGFRRPSKVFEDGVAGGRNAILGLPGAIPIEGGLPLIVEGKI